MVYAVAGRPRPRAGMILAIPRVTLGLLLTAVLAAGSACTPGSALSLPLTFKLNIQLPRDTSQPSIDLLSLDTRNSRLYVPHSSNNALDLVDIGSNRYIGSVQGLAGIKGVALSSDPNIVFTSNGSDGSVSVVDVNAMKVLSKIQVGGSPDAIDYDPVHAMVVVSLGTGASVAFIDEATRKETSKMALPGKPELMAVDRQQGRVYIAIHDQNEVVQLDPASQAILKTYKGCDIQSPTGLAFDPDQQRLFVANAITRSANVASIIDVLLDRCLGSADVDHGPDQAAFNGHLHHVYVANGGSNNVTVIDSVSLKPLGVIGTGKQAATIAADPANDNVYVAAARAGLIAVYHDP